MLYVACIIFLSPQVENCLTSVVQLPGTLADQEIIAMTSTHTKKILCPGSCQYANRAHNC